MMKVDDMTTGRETIWYESLYVKIILVWIHCYDMWTSAGFQVMRLPKTE
jgi:hypothetical protein